MYEASFQVNDLPMTFNTLTSKGWRVRSNEKRKWHRIIQELFTIKGLKIPPQPLMKAQLILTRYSSHTLDYDGLVGSFKYVIDGLVEMKVLEDDGMAQIGMPTFHWIKVAPKHGMIKVQIQECA